MAEKKEKQYVSDNAQLMVEWDWEKNAELIPSKLTLGSNKKVWWKCSKGHTWQSVVAHRTKGSGCPYCAHKKVLVGFNDLATTHPDLAAEWHPSKNEGLLPTDITRGAGKKVWWLCKNGHEFIASPNKRTTEETSCPYCSNQKVLRGFNDLATTRPRLAEEWHPTKNGMLLPSDIVEGSAKKVWWKCAKGHEWQAAPYNRIKNRNCPICSKQLKTSFPEQALFYYIKKHFPDAENTNTTAINMELDVYIPSLRTAIEYDGVYYHKSANSKNREQRKNRLCNDNGIRLIRVREIGLNSYEDCICIIDVNPSNIRAIDGTISAVLELLGIEEYKIDIDADSPEILSWYLSSEHTRNLLAQNPLLASEWHSAKNGELKPEHLAFNSGKKVWWICEKGHEWQASLHNRSKGKGCPYCSGRLAIKGENDLLTLRPDIVREWDFEQNDFVQPTEVKLGSNEKVWWICSTCGHKWKTTINARTSGHGCPKCGELKKGPQRKTHEIFSQELKIANPDVELVDTYVVSTSKVKCQCLICKHEWYALPGNLLKGKGCPCCSGRSVISGKNDLEHKFPNIAKEWDTEKNKPLLPSEVKYGSNKIVWWKCSTCGHSWQMSITNRTTGYGCPDCRGERIGNRLRKRPEVFANEIKTINPHIKLLSEYFSAKQKIKCLCLLCKNEWQTLPSNLLKGHGCPECARQKHKKSK